MSYIGTLFKIWFVQNSGLFRFHFICKLNEGMTH